jgi:flavin-dependent dehydrogenase
LLLNCDVLIIGGGPAGSATALALKKHAPQLSVLLVEASSYERARIGEVLPALARGLLEHLDIRQAFEDKKHPPVHSSISAWGDARPHENHFIYSTHGAGWHLDRKAFDAFLAAQAEQKGVHISLKTRAKIFAKNKNGWRAEFSDGSEAISRFIVDATGRHAFFARKMGADTGAVDKLMSFSRVFSLDETPAPETAIEAFEHGWWYTARAGNARVISCLTDTDIAGKLNLNEKTSWLKLLSETVQIKSSLGNGAVQDECLTRAANSVLMSKTRGDNWLSVGEAASAFDPLSSQGIMKSLRSGIFASYAIADLLCNSSEAAMPRYEKFIRTEFASYLELYKKYYSNERRWPGSAFWQRRQN